MNYGLYGKPFVKPFGKPFAKAGPYVIGPGFATFPAAGATIARGFTKSVPVSKVRVSPYPFGKFYGI